MMKRLLLPFVLMTLLLTMVITQAQEIEPRTEIDDSADVLISFPPPVWVLNGTIEILGTADAIDMDNYFVEFRPLQLDDAEPDSNQLNGAEDEDRPWFPATLPSNRAVRNGSLGRWNTATARDGLYEIRLVVNLGDDSVDVFRVSPIRIENDPDDLALLPQATPFTSPPENPTPTQLGAAPRAGRPTLAPTPTQLNTQPQVTAVVDANVRRGDDTSYARVGALLRGETAAVIGISSFGSGWFFIEMDDGTRGFIAPNIVEFQGDTSNLQRIEPPPPPTPPATATPITSANLQITGLRTEPVQPVCGEAFDIFINVQNTGTGSTSGPGSLSIVDRHVNSGSQQGSTTGGYPIIGPGDSFVVVATLTINTFFEEAHDVVVTLDPGGTIPETNEGDNTTALRYTLDQGSCG